MLLNRRTLAVGILASALFFIPGNAQAFTMPHIVIPTITIPSFPSVSTTTTSVSTTIHVSTTGNTNVTITNPENAPSPEVGSQTLTQPTPTPTRFQFHLRRITPTPTSPTLTKMPTPTPTKSVTPTQSPTNTPSSLLDDKQQYMLNAINAYRKQNNLYAVQPDKYTCDFAATRAKEIVSNFSHDGWIARANSHTLPYPSYSYVNENIAMTSNYQNVVTMWINSPGHAANMRADTPYVCVAYSGNYFAYEGWRP
jgi:uncharacterized protein YkwD